MGYQSLIGSSHNFNNITVSIGEFSSDIGISSSATYGPGIVNIDGSYQTVVLRSISSVTESTFNQVAFNRQIYSGYGNKILFCFFPICYTNNKDIIPKLMEYTTLTKDQIQNYSTISITPQGNFITSPIILDRIFCENGLYSTNTTQKNLTSKSHNYVSSTSNCTVFNWQITQGYTYLINKSNGSESTNTKSSMSIRTFNFGETIQRTDNNKNSTSKFPRFKYVYGQNNVILYGAAKHQKPTDTTQLCVRRVYSLYDWDKIHPQIGNNNQNETLQVDKYPFFFMIKLSRRSKGRAVLSFGHNECPIKIYVSRCGNVLSVGRNNINVDLQYDQKNPPRLPFFMKHPSLKQAISMIVYPTYLGISIQSGIQQGGKNIDSRTGSSFFKPNGNFCKFGGIRTGYGSTENKVYTRYFPTFQSWVTHYTKSQSLSKDGVQHIFAQPWQLSWQTNKGEPLKLQFDNASGSFMFVPLHFLPYARFRMYFKGIKAGYYKNDLPVKSDEHFYSSNCSCGTVWQYTYKSNASKEENDKGDPTISHQYFGSLLFSCQYKYQTSGQTDSNKTVIDTCKEFITNPTIAYRVPPPNFDANSDDEKKYFSTYSMDAYYFDFQINMSEVASENGQTLPRLPIQILGVLILQQVIAVKSLVDNGNGKFEMGLQGYGYNATVQLEQTDIIQIYKSGGTDCCSSLKDWDKCILSVNVTHNQQGSTGSIIVDKYALMGQQAMPRQCIGGLSLSIEGGNPNVINNDNISSSSSVVSKFRNSNILFTGYVSKMSTNDSANSDTITMTLQGIQKKLTQIKLINPPFWDGDKLKDILNWLSFYAGVDINYIDDNINIFDTSEIMDQLSDGARKWYDKNGEEQNINTSDLPIVPVSSVFSRPAVNYKSGQDCFTVLKNVCFKQCNHRFVLQPDGKAYIFTQSRMAMPLACNIDDHSHCHTACIDPNLIINFSIQPLMNNLYNFIITASLQGVQQGTKQTGIGDALSGIKLNKKAQQVYSNTNSNPWAVQIPWSKILAMKHEGYMSQSQLSQQHKRNLMMVKNYMLNLKVTIPGNTNIWIYDKATIFGVEYYVTQVSHSVDLSTKRFTTDVTLCSCVQNVN